jgi:hypothetical protein
MTSRLRQPPLDLKISRAILSLAVLLLPVNGRVSDVLDPFIRSHGMQHPFTIGQYIVTWIGVLALFICGAYTFAFPRRFQRNAIKKYERRSRFTRRLVSLSYLKSATYFWHLRIGRSLAILMAVFISLCLLGVFGKFEVGP